MRKHKKYEYSDKIYSGERYFGDGDSISDLLNELEDKKEIETQTIKIYNVKGCDGYYTDDEIDGLLEKLVECEIIEESKVGDKEDLGEELCLYCPATEHGENKVNTNPYNLCEGRYCDIAYTYYLEEQED